MSILDWPLAAAGRGRRRRSRPYSHVRLDLDLRHEQYREPTIPVLRQVERLLRERSVVEQGNLLRLSAAALHAFSVRGFARVDHWEIEPGGWLALPEPTHKSIAEPVSHLVRALEGAEWRRFASAREFSVRISGHPKVRADLVVRRVHRERGHAMTIDLWGLITDADLNPLLRALRARLPILRASVADFAYRTEKS
ncbi:MAG: hypothetical protein WBF81_02830 [Thermoplasmata archaeon]